MYNLLNLLNLLIGPISPLANHRSFPVTPFPSLPGENNRPCLKPIVFAHPGH